MVRQESNFDLQRALTKVLDTKVSKLVSFNLQMQSIPQMFTGVNGISNMWNNPPEIMIDLVFYIDQSAPLGESNSFIVLEKKISKFLEAVDGHFTNRSMQHNANEIMSVNYRVRLYDYDLFTLKVEELYKAQIDKEFTAVLESTLSED